MTESTRCQTLHKKDKYETDVSLILFSFYECVTTLNEIYLRRQVCNLVLPPRHHTQPGNVPGIGCLLSRCTHLHGGIPLQGTVLLMYPKI